MNALKNIVLIVVLVAACGCTLAKVQVDVASERTTLENQVLGSYNALNRQAMLTASVRGVDPLGQVQPPATMSAGAQDAVDAMQVIAFHADDVDAFKQLGWVGEANDGLLQAFAMERENVPDELADFVSRYSREEFDSVVLAVNNARMTTMRRVVETNADLDADDMERVQAVFGSLNAENALSGERIQGADGRWTVKQ
ncbi:DUF1318 domain-containing protein [Pseudodesulfovibrio senegalensis]|jgi:uncharacterized protein YdbL (DUF1318 family)|uniref:DUF1318 domain-containing protein n=1 Tax=Pseudodesulfovibrio senegalensis TaxID=1721087 RepID=UPI001F4FB237|nr:DUF1318 domain-containing protein [Pseudodesulfovibrio senegalensis]